MLPIDGRAKQICRIIVIVLGVLSLLAAVTSTLLSVFLIGCLLVAACASQASFAFTSGRWSGFGMHLLLAALYGIAGFGMKAAASSVRPIRSFFDERGWYMGTR